jgi:hypothetical protein
MRLILLSVIEQCTTLNGLLAKMSYGLLYHLKTYCQHASGILTI